jgi:hypothetical protein
VAGLKLRAYEALEALPVSEMGVGYASGDVSHVFEVQHVVFERHHMLRSDATDRTVAPRPRPLSSRGDAVRLNAGPRRGIGCAGTVRERHDVRVRRTQCAERANQHRLRDQLGRDAATSRCCRARVGDALEALGFSQRVHEPAPHFVEVAQQALIVTHERG